MRTATSALLHCTAPHCIQAFAALLAMLGENATQALAPENLPVLQTVGPMGVGGRQDSVLLGGRVTMQLACTSLN